MSSEVVAIGDCLTKKGKESKTKESKTKESNTKESKTKESKTKESKTKESKEEEGVKRGRKPRGGKLVLREALVEPNVPPAMENVILHLKCSLKDLEEHNCQFSKIMKDPLLYDPNVPPEIMTFDVMSSQTYGVYEPIATEGVAYAGLCKKCNESLGGVNEMSAPTSTVAAAAAPTTLGDIHSKIKDLKIAYYKGAVDLNRRSCCFWCTYEFDNKPCFIPRQEWSDTVLVYGYFCSAECAAAHLFQENIDDHTKFERYHYINKMYGADKEGIKPAPNPHYLLDRFMGSLTIAEYRSLFHGRESLVTVEKPMTRVLPEIHADNDTVGSTYKIKRASTSTKK